MATLQAQTIIVVLFAPNQTIKTGASADFGRAFKITRYGSSTLDNVSFHQKIVATNKLPRITMKNPIKVSNRVTDI